MDVDERKAGKYISTIYVSDVFWLGVEYLDVAYFNFTIYATFLRVALVGAKRRLVYLDFQTGNHDREPPNE